jgi:hypothetical protein
MLDNNILDKISSPTADQLASIQDNVLGSILSTSRLTRMTTSANRFTNTYNIDELFSDLKKGIWSELAAKKKIDGHRRNLQKAYAERMISLLGNNAGGGLTLSMGGAMSMGADTKKTDITSVVRAHLASLKSEIQTAAAGMPDAMSKYHLQDVAERIKNALDPK